MVLRQARRSCRKARADSAFASGHAESNESSNPQSSGYTFDRPTLKIGPISPMSPIPDS